MSELELLEAFLAGELDAEGEARVEELISSRPGLLAELAQLRAHDLALRAFLGTDDADRKVVRAVLDDLAGKPAEDLKTAVMDQLREEDVRLPERAAPVEAPRRARRAERPRAVLWGAAAASLAIAAVLFFARGGETPREVTAYVLSASPGARATRGDESFALAVDMVLRSGDQVRTGAGESATLRFSSDPTTIELGENAALVIHGGKGRRVELQKGEMKATVEEPLAIESSRALARVSRAQLRLAITAEFVRLEVKKGEVSFARRSDARWVNVGSGQYAVADDEAPLMARALAPEAKPAADAPAILKQVRGDVFLFAESPSDRKPAQAGQPVPAGLLTGSAGSRAVVEYPDATLIEVGANTVIRRFAEARRKDVLLEQGVIAADVVKQPAGLPMRLTTRHAGVQVLGTRFTLSSDAEFTRVQVEEGAVRFSRPKEGATIEVRSGYYAVAAAGIPFEPAPIPGGARYLDIDLTSGASDGEGDWAPDGRTVRQTRVAPAAANCVFATKTERSVMIEATVRAEQVAPEGAWGFGLSACLGGRDLVLRTLQSAGAGSVFEFGGLRSIPFEHGRDGSWRLKLHLERRDGMPVVLRGKIWQGDREPDGWMIEDELAPAGPVTRVGFHTIGAACSFSRFRVEVLK